MKARYVCILIFLSPTLFEQTYNNYQYHLRSMPSAYNGINILAQADTAGNAKVVTDWQQTPTFVWELFRAISNFLVRRHKKNRPLSLISGAILDFFIMKWHIFVLRAIKHSGVINFSSYCTKGILTVCDNKISNPKYFRFASFLSQVHET